MFVKQQNSYIEYTIPVQVTYITNYIENVCSSPVYTIQPIVKPVVKPVWQPVWQPAVSVYRVYIWLSKRLYNRFDNRLYRVNEVSQDHRWLTEYRSPSLIGTLQKDWLKIQDVKIQDRVKIALLLSA